MVILTALFLVLGCASAKYQIIHGHNHQTKSNTIYEINNNIYGPNGMVELNLFYDKNSQDLSIKFHYRDNDWLFIEENESFMFIFEYGDIVTLSSKGKIYTNVNRDGLAPEIIEEKGKLHFTKIMMQKVLEEDIIGVRINGNNRYKEYNKGMVRLQRRWKKMLLDYPQIMTKYP